LALFLSVAAQFCTKHNVAVTNNNSPQEVAERLLRILSKDELNAVASDAGLGAGAHLNAIAASLGNLSRYEIARIVFKAACSTLLLLQDIFANLTSFGVSARTTGCVFVLADTLHPGQQCELEFSPQAIGCISDWRTDHAWGPVDGQSLQSLLSKWRSLNSPLSQILQAAAPRKVEGDIDVVETFIQSRMAQARGDASRELIREPDHVYRNSEAEVFLHFVISRVTEVAHRLSHIPVGSQPAEVKSIVRYTTEFLRQSGKILPSSKYLSKKTNVAQPSQHYLRRHERFLRDFDRFREDLFLLADLIEGERLFDILRLDVWSSRPQLFEVWTLLAILRWLAHRGYGIELLKLEQTVGAIKWQLAYAKDKEPCALVKGTPKGSVSYLYYQLFRSSGDMPDLALLSGAESSSAPIWSVDPKHSEKEGYSIKAYQRTAERYRDSFGAPLSIVAEYFERSDCAANPIDFGHSAYLIHNCQPGKQGLALLLNQLSSRHPVIRTTLVCLDVSQSFRPHLPYILPGLLRTLDGENGRWLDEVVCFAGSAIRKKGLRGFLESGDGLDTSSLGLNEGTNAEPLVQAVAGVVQESGANRIILVTDGVFDLPLDALIQRFRSEMSVAVDIINAPAQ
jgi:hypothetical protein